MNRQRRNIFLVLCMMFLSLGFIKQKQETKTNTNGEENTELSVVYFKSR